MPDPVLDAITPNPVVVPYGMSADVLAAGHLEDDGIPVEDTHGELSLSVGTSTVTVNVTVDVPDFPWSDVAATTDLTGVTVANNGGGSFTLTHT